MPSERTDGFIERLTSDDAVLSVRVLRGASLQPAGDVVAFDVLDDGFSRVMRLLDAAGLGTDPSVSVTTSLPQSVASKSSTPRVVRDRSVSSWEEVQLTISRESAMTNLKLVIMVISGLLAAVGLHTGALHLVVGAMLVAPAYEPMSHVAFALVNRTTDVRSGVYDILRAYGALIVGAAVFAGLSYLSGTEPLSSAADTYMSSGVLVSYWTTTTWTSVLVGAAGGLAGGLLIVINRRVLATGVVIALALVPSLTLAVLELSIGEPVLALKAALRWGTDAVLVVLGCAAVFAVKRWSDQRTMGPTR